MFDYSKMIKRAIEFFPQWSDIRKRYKTSVGGHLMSSVLDESVKIEDAIQDYIDSYFLYNYIGHEDEVMAFVYMANVGQLEKISPIEIDVNYNNKGFYLTEDIKEFENNYRAIFYEDGKIYLKIEDYEDIDEIELSIDDSVSKYKIKRVHVWNIFDEFATFVNTRRYENETNSQLLNRILYITRNLPNGTEEGLKHAIISELMFDCPEITEDEIKIEGPTPENLIKPYEDYETLLDMLAEINRDVYRTKRWDLDYWKYEFKSIEYIPHVWNKAIKYWQNGIGSGDDLQVILADESNTTNAEIFFYKKTLEAFQKYVYDKYIEDNIHFTLTKYNDILNKTKILYKIQASELKDISYEDIYLKIYESEKRTTEIPLQEIITGWGKDIENEDMATLGAGDENDYVLHFKSKTDYDLIISKADVVYQHKDTGEVTNILSLTEDEQPGFLYNSEYELVSTATKDKIDNVENFNSYEGLKNEEGCITLDDGYNAGEATYSLKNKANLYVSYKYDCQSVRLPDNLIYCMGAYWNNDDEFVVRGDYSIEQKQVIINIDANYLAFKLSEDNINARITMTVEDEVFGTYIDKDLGIKNEIKFERTDKPRKIKLIIDILSIEDVKFYDFEYSNYTIDLNTKYGTLKRIETDGKVKFQLGNFYNNELRLTVSARTGCNPMIQGIFIGESFKDIIFKSKKIPYVPNHTRLFEIITNGEIDLIKLVDDVESTEEEDIIRNFKPMTMYKATSDNAYLRVDLSDYDFVESIEVEKGSVKTIEDGGRFFYNIHIREGEKLGTITVKGTKSVEARIVSLRDMITFYIKDFNPTYDKIYCCKCSKGLIVGRQNPGGTPYNMIVNVRSDAFTGIDAVKYEMMLPSHLGSIFGNEVGGESRMKTITHSFDYISIYPDNSQIYQAINEFETCIRDNRNIKITNNFSPALDQSKLLFYSVSIYDEKYKDDVLVRFHNELNVDIDIHDLPDWSIGTSNSYIAIHNNINMLNDMSYHITSYDVEDTIYLSSSVDIKDTYQLTNLTILNTEKFMVSTKNENVTIKYDYYDGTSKKSYLLKHEEIIVEADGFNKLEYSNIDTIYHISTSPFDGEYLDEVTGYEILKDPGIIVWNDERLIKNNNKIYLIYSIKKPIAFVFDIDYLYKAIDFDVEAYEMSASHKVENLSNGSTIDFIEDAYYNSIVSSYDNVQPDLIYVSCDNPTFESQLFKDGTGILFNKYTTKNTLLVKTGYYYINGREYYLFSEEDTESIKNNMLYKCNNVDISGGEMTTYKPTNNYIANSEMRLKGMAELYNFNCSQPLTYGVSNLNSLTACDSFNEWKTFGMQMTLTDSLNGLGINFKQNIENGYAVLDITDSLIYNKYNYISFFANKELKTYIGKEKSYSYVDFNRSLNIVIDDEIEFENSDIRNATILTQGEYRYYLIVQGEGVIDDIIVSTDPESVYKSHTKNISLLGFKLYEKRPEGSRYKLTINSDKDYKPYLAGLMSDGSFKTTSNVDWHITKIFSMVNDDDFRKCVLHNVGIEDDYIFTTNRDGYIETLPIYIGEIDNIKRIVFKINNINFVNMRGFRILVETCDKHNGIYVPCGTSNNNSFHINQEYLNSYIKFKIEMPPNKYIDDIDIYADYISTDENPLSIITKQSGYIESKIYDLQEVTNCFVKSIDIEDIGNINDVSIYIRSSKDEERLDVWNDWREIKLNNDLSISKMVNFTNVRFLQFKIVLKTRKAFIKLKGINIEIK